MKRTILISATIVLGFTTLNTTTKSKKSIYKTPLETTSKEWVSLKAMAQKSNLTSRKKRINASRKKSKQGNNFTIQFI
ncbi:hypothetical protein [Winogradskyella vidalii]|uniref:hypothetical protein n=1 Tax=Winogradskyella vidalii TaxID=2615024 RepID=UPI0015CEEEEC|nr:hypothetical protein [Winogradskyella vidalii]